MIIIPIHTTVLKSGDNLADAVLNSCDLHNGDILVISSKAVARTEGATVDLAKIKPTTEAEKLSKIAHQDPRFTELVLRETKRMNGEILSTSPHAILTSLKPTGMNTGRILCPNAGLDQSNIEKNHAIGWPMDAEKSVKELSTTLKVPVIISDSCCTIGRLGVIAFALTCCGIDPFANQIGKKDLFGKSMRLTQEAVADQLATAANAVMGNTDLSCPAAIIRDHGLPFSDFCGWVEGIEPEEDLFHMLYGVKGQK